MSLSKLSSGHRTGKGQFSFQFQRKAMPKNAQVQFSRSVVSNSSHEVAKVLEFQLYIIPSKEIPGLISFRMNWLDLLAVQGIKRHTLIKML